MARLCPVALEIEEMLLRKFKDVMERDLEPRVALDQDSRSWFLLISNTANLPQATRCTLG